MLTKETVAVVQLMQERCTVSLWDSQKHSPWPFLLTGICLTFPALPFSSSPPFPTVGAAMPLSSQAPLAYSIVLMAARSLMTALWCLTSLYCISVYSSSSPVSPHFWLVTPFIPFSENAVTFSSCRLQISPARYSQPHIPSCYHSTNLGWGHSCSKVSLC